MQCPSDVLFFIQSSDNPTELTNAQTSSAFLKSFLSNFSMISSNAFLTQSGQMDVVARAVSF
jgi:hypothetical protein